MSAAVVGARRKAAVPATKAEAAQLWRRCGLIMIPADQGIALTSWGYWLNRRKHKARVHEWWCRRPNDDVGALLDNHVLACDANTPEALYALQIIERAMGKEPNQIHVTPTGERHFFRRPSWVRAAMETHSEVDFPKRITVRTGGWAVDEYSLVMLPPSDGFVVKLGKASSVKRLVEVDQAFVDAIARHNGRRSAEKYVVWPDDRNSDASYIKVEQLLRCIRPNNRTTWITGIRAIHHVTGGSGKGYKIAERWTEASSDWAALHELPSLWGNLS